MKKITQYINEFVVKKHINNSKRRSFKYFPKDKEELEILITKRIQEEGNDVDLNDIDISKVSDMSFMFMGQDFKGDVSCWDVSHVTDMYEMFSFCKEFDCDISEWDISNVNDFQLMFRNCENLKKEYFESWGDKIKPTAEMNKMFEKSNIEGNYPSWW